eukprot:gene13199-15593_t
MIYGEYCQEITAQALDGVMAQPLRNPEEVIAVSRAGAKFSTHLHTEVMTFAESCQDSASRGQAAHEIEAMARQLNDDVRAELAKGWSTFEERLCEHLVQYVERHPAVQPFQAEDWVMSIAKTEGAGASNSSSHVDSDAE